MIKQADTITGNNNGKTLPKGMATTVAVMTWPLGHEYLSKAFIDKFNARS